MAADHYGPPSLPGHTFVRRLGRGGFADVYLYEQQMPRREVAVKVLFHDADDDVHERFTTEANVVAQLSGHPAIVPIYQAGLSDDGRPYLVLEYCPGPNLAVRSAAQPLSVLESLAIVIQVAGAVETAHRAGILHRDIKPHNILTNAYGRAKLTDFGIALVSDHASAQGGTGLSVPWAPPELLDAGRPSVASDVYSLAATLYSLLAGRSPFELAGGDNDQVAVMMRIARQAVRRIGREDIPDLLYDVLDRGLSKDPQARYPSALAFAHALQSVQDSMLLAPTAVDVFDASPAGHGGEPDDGGRTRVRPIAVIDPVDAPASTEPTHAPVATPASGVPPAGHTRWRIVAGATVALLLAGGVVAGFLSGGDQVDRGPHDGSSEPGQVVTSRPQAPQALLGVRHDDGTVVFTWKNPSPEDGDTYLWRFDEAGLSTRPVEVDKPRAEFTVPQGRDGCIIVMTVRGGQASDPTPHSCPDREKR